MRRWDRMQHQISYLFLDRAGDFGDDGVEGLKHYLDTVPDKKRESRQRQGDTFELDRLAVGPQHAQEAAEDRAKQYPQGSVEAVSGHQSRRSHPPVEVPIDIGESTEESEKHRKH